MSAIVTLAIAALSARRARHVSAQTVFPGDLTAALGVGGVEQGPLPPPPPLSEAPDVPQEAFGADGPQPAPARPDVILEPLPMVAVDVVEPGCGCTSSSCVTKPDPSGVREVSDLMDGGTAKSSRLTNMVWSWGQFLDHDMVASFVDANGGDFEIELPRHTPEVKRVNARCFGKCRSPRSIQTALLDAGPVYSASKVYRDTILREPSSCFMRTSRGDLPPVTTFPVPVIGEGGEETEKHILLAGDSRVNEHAVLTNMHIVWIREHNRLCEVVTEAEPDLSGDEAFELVREIVIGKFHEITLNEWLPALGITPDEIRNYTPTGPLKSRSSLSTEFFITYRWGHDAIPDRVGGLAVSELFDGEKYLGIPAEDGAAGTPDPEAANDAVDSLLSGTATEAQAELDGKMSDALRNMLFGNLDLASFNIFRARDIGLPAYEALAECYGTTPAPNAPTQDPFVATLAEGASTPAGQSFGPLLKAIMIDQFHRLLFGPEGNWWQDKGFGGSFAAEIEGTKLSSVINANSKANVPTDVFLL